MTPERDNRENYQINKNKTVKELKSLSFQVERAHHISKKMHEYMKGEKNLTHRYETPEQKE